jgi:hypothetical protein
MTNPAVDINGVAVVRYQEKPLEVVVKNWADSFAKPRLVRRTTTKTWTVDPTAATLAQYGAQQIAAFEPQRMRMVVQVLDAPVVILTEAPRNTPDTATSAPGNVPEGGGRLLLAGGAGVEYVFYGPDEFWINSITGATVTRVTVTKEYC